MSALPQSVKEFLGCQRLAVAGVSREPNAAGNVILRKLRDNGHETFAVNPHASSVEGGPCYPDLASLPTTVEGVVIATPPSASVSVVQQCAALGIPRIWLHRSFGRGSVSSAAVKECEHSGIDCIVGGCPLMYCEPVDFGHRCMRWWLAAKGRVPRS